METQVVEYNITDAVIAEMESLYMGLTITDLNNKEEFDAVHSARMVVKGKRVEVEKTRKGLKADALAWGKKVDTEAKRIFALLEPIETHLSNEEQKVIDEQNRIKAEEEEKERARIQAMIDKLQEYGIVKPYIEIASMSEAEYGTILKNAIQDHAEEQERLVREAEQREAEAKRLEAEREELEKLQEQAERDRRIEKEKREAEERKLAEERTVIEAEKKAFEDARRAEAEKKEREEREKREAKERAEKEAAEKAEAEKQAKLEAERREALKPDIEKLKAWVSEFEFYTDPPKIQDDELSILLDGAIKEIYDILNDLSEKIEKL